VSPAPLLSRRASAFYAATLAGAVAAFLVIRSYGEQLVPPAAVAPAGRAAGAESAVSPFFHVLLAMAAVILVGRILGRALASIRQPPVVGEVVAGILLGPSLLARISPAASAYVLPASTAPLLNAVAQLGVTLYMFVVGLDLNLDRVRQRAESTILTSHASIVAPFVLGSLLSLYLYPRLAPSGVPFTSFALFIGVAMSITAFPVLARILADRRMTSSELGTIALTCAAVDDVTAWCLLAVVVGVAQSTLHGAGVVVLSTLAFITLMVTVVRPAIVQFMVHGQHKRAGAGAATPVAPAGAGALIVPGALARPRPAEQGDANEAVAPGNGIIGAALAGMLLSALTTEWIGVHAIFGAFLFGAVIPHDSAVARTLGDKLKDLVTILLLPAFFAFAGMRTRLDLVSGPGEWFICALIVAVATLGKFGGSYAAARFTGMPVRKAAGLGILLNTRGLMELIVLNIGLDLGVISPALFTMMVLMALATTVATTPVLERLFPSAAALQSSRLTEAR